MERNNLLKSRYLCGLGILKRSQCTYSSSHGRVIAATSLLSSAFCLCSKEESKLHVDKIPFLSHLFQSSSNSCSILDAAKHQDIGLPRAFSFCYQQEIESTKQTLGSRNRALPEQVWIKVGGKPPSGREQVLLLLPDLCPSVIVSLGPGVRRWFIDLNRS